ncbi:tryptase-like [Aricia agestis]|uniref:tryptase-like n=1 Tax=Aricia agestis TaxID=91739 RepID=UPI001C207FF0|nr:tryptase-like [Aricia agestis]
MFCLLLLIITNICGASVFQNRVDHGEFYRNRSSSKALSFSTSYLNQNFVSRGSEKESVQCGTRTVDFTLRRGKIVGGSEAPYGAFPWQVDIQMLDVDKLNFEHHCGGAVLAERLVLSAAHCFDRQPLELEHIRLLVGQHRLNLQDKHEHRFLVDKVVPHPDFRKEGPHSHDIALVLVARSGGGVRFDSHVRPICLPAEDAPIAPGAWCAVSGWGYQSEGTESFAPVLRAAAVPILELSTCRKSQVLGGRQQPILDSMLCAGVLSGGVDACRGDSGGPLACATGGGGWQLRGVVSWGAGCARPGRPGVYTRVAAYLPWLKRAAQALGQKL